MTGRRQGVGGRGEASLGARYGASLALLVGAAVELVVFVVVGQLIGFALAVLLVGAASLTGLVLLRREGLRAWRGFQQAIAAGSPPGRHVTNGVVGLGGALLLAAPGLVSGVAGLMLLLPPVRWLARARVQARAERQMSSADAGAMFGPRRVQAQRNAEEDSGEVLDGEVLDGEVLDGEVLDGEVLDG